MALTEGMITYGSYSEEVDNIFSIVLTQKKKLKTTSRYLEHLAHIPSAIFVVF